MNGERHFLQQKQRSIELARVADICHTAVSDQATPARLTSASD